MSILPIAVNLVLEEKGVIIAQPGNKSLALRSIECTSVSSLVKRLYNEFWCLAINSLHLQDSLVNFNCLQLLNTLCWVDELRNIFWYFWSRFINDIHLVLDRSKFLLNI